MEEEKEEEKREKKVNPSWCVEQCVKRPPVCLCVLVCP